MAGAFDNIAAAARERRRREQMALENPGMGLSLVSQSPEWDAFFGGLHDIQDAGMGLRMDWRGFGRDANEDTGNGGGPSVFDRESLKNQAIAQMSNAAAQQARAQNFGQDAYNDQQERERIADLYRAYAQQQQAQQQAPLIPAENTKINVDTSRTSGNTVSSRPAGDETQQMLARLDPISRIKAQNDIAEAEAKKKLSDAAMEKATPQGAVIEPNTPQFKTAQDLAYGKMTFQQFRTLVAYGRDPNLKMGIYAKAAELNPEFNPADFERGYKFMSNPKVAQQLASLDNVSSGVDDLLRVSDEASRSGITALNKIINPVEVAIGNKKFSNFKTARTAFADELSGALGYGSATDMSREMGFNMTDDTLSPENFRDAIQSIVIPFVDRKRASMLKQGSIYGKSENNTAVSPALKVPSGGRGANPFRK